MVRLFFLESNLTVSTMVGGWATNFFLNDGKKPSGTKYYCEQ